MMDARCFMVLYATARIRLGRKRTGKRMCIKEGASGSRVKRNQNMVIGRNIMRNKLGLILAVVVLAATVSMGAEGGWLTDFEAAKKLAQEKNLPILADFSGSDWCGWCIKLDKEVFSQKVFKDYAKGNVVLFLADFPSKKKQDENLKKQNKKLSAEYKVKGFPTVLVLDAKGKVLAKTGYRRGGAEGYVEHIKGILKEKLGK